MQAKKLIHGGLGLIVLALGGLVNSQSPADKEPDKGSRKPSVSINDDKKAFKGYTLIAPLNSKKTHLIDMEGRIVHSWESDCTPALIPYLLDNGNLLRPGAGGRLQEFSWQGKLLWDYKFTGSKNQLSHHDIRRLPNGNILMLILEHKNREEALAVGRRPDLLRSSLNVDGIVEVKPTGRTTGDIVWEWHSWDHLIQERDQNKVNFGKVSEHAERIDINYVDEGTKFLPDLSHCNSVAYNGDLDQIMISSRHFSEIWIIDHSTSKAEAASSKGGKYGKGGDLLYRWGNPRAYGAGTSADQRLFYQHDAHWISKGLPGAGNILIFNNGSRRTDREYSSVDEIVLPQNKDGTYDRQPGRPYGPIRTEWSYTAEQKKEFFSWLISGAQRLPNGNTLICSGNAATVFEVTPRMEVVWRFVNPVPGLAGELFRSYRFGVDHPALKGKNLTPGKKLEEL